MPIEAIVLNAKTPASGILGTAVGVAVLIFGASGVFGELRSALNTIWGVARVGPRAPCSPRKALWPSSRPPRQRLPMRRWFKRVRSAFCTG